MSKFRVLWAALVVLCTTTPIASVPASAQQQQQKPNVVFIMGDDIGWFNIGAYHRGIMAGRTPNLDQLASEGMMFTDYYAEASCTAGRANFITGELPIRTGLTTVGQAGSPIGMPDEAPTIATVLKSMGYATGQFGKNHLGDRNQFLPTVHGFDEFFGYLYHLDGMEDPCHRNYPPALKATVGPRNMLHTWATDKDDPTEQPRWGKVGKQRIEDAGELCPKRMETVDDEILAHGSPMWVSSKRPPSNLSLHVLCRPDLPEVVHSVGCDRDGAALVSEQVEIGPHRCARERYTVDQDGLVLQYVNVRAGGGFLCLLDGPVYIAAICLMIAGDVDRRSIRHALAQPLHPTLRTRNKVASHHQDIEMRTRVSRRQIPATG
jgi:hypothetical protein